MRIPEYDDGYDSAALFEAAGADRPEDMEPREAEGDRNIPDLGEYLPRQLAYSGSEYLESDADYVHANFGLVVKLLDQYGVYWHGRCSVED